MAEDRSEPAPQLRRDPRVEAAVGGDRKAMHALIREVGPAILRAVRALLGVCREVEDVAQEAVLGFVRALPAWRAACPLDRYAARIATRAAIDWRRRWRPRESLLPDGRAAEPIGAQSFASGSGSARRRMLFRDALVDLPEGQAEALVLRVVFEHSLEEVAAITGVPLNTVRSRLRLARDHLRERLARDDHALALLEVES